MNNLYGATGAIILVFIFFILKKKDKSTADYLLVLVNLLVGLFMVADVWVLNSMSSGSIIFQNAVPLLLFPTFILYANRFVRTKSENGRWLYLLFLPFVMLMVLSITDHYILDNYTSNTELLEHYDDPTIWYQVIFKSSQLLFMGVLIWLIKQINAFGKKIKEGYSAIETIELKWLKSFTIIYLASIALSFILFLSYNLGLLPFDIKAVFGIVYGVLIVSVFYLNIQGIKHYTISQYITKLNHTSQVDSDRDIHNNIPAEAKEENTQIYVSLAQTGNKDDDELEKRILNLIEEEQLYLEPKLTLDNLASNIGINKNTVSRIINKEENRTFYSLINGYRVQNLKERMMDEKNKHLTILAMGLDSGFNSKASLNRIFKQHTGDTPKEFMDKMSQPVHN